MAPKSKTKAKRRANLFGIPLDNVDTEAINNIVEKYAAKPKPMHIVSLSWWDFIRAKTKWEYRAIVKHASLVVPHSHLLSCGIRATRQSPINFVSEFDFLIKLLAILERHAMSIVLLGMALEEIHAIEQNIRNTYPDLKIVGRFSGFFNKQQEQAIQIAIRKANPDFIFVGSGLYINEVWLYEIKHKLNPAILFWSRKVMEALAMQRNRYPKSALRAIAQSIGAYIRRPWRIYRFFVFLVYIIAVIITRLNTRRRKGIAKNSPVL